MQVKEAIEVFELTNNNLSEHTQRWYSTKLRLFAEWCEAVAIELEQVTPQQVKRYIGLLQEKINPQSGKRITSDTVHGHAKVIKLFLAWCAQDEEFSEYVKSRTVKLISLPKVEAKVIETFTSEQIKALFGACQNEFASALVKRDIAILSLLLDTGVRASELCGLTLGNIFIAKDEAYIKVLGKGKKEREIGLGDKARAELHRYIRQYRKGARPDEPVFLSRFNEPLTTNGLDQLLCRLRDWARLGDTRAGAHKFRHTFAVNYLLNGGDVYKLSRLMGHTSVSTTERYVRSMKQRDARKGNSVLDNLM
jgi:site-specific recombinase XerD